MGPNQVCTLFGSKGGSTLISGKAYIAAGYGFDNDDLWKRCFLVLFAFTITLQILQIIALEFFPVSAELIFLKSTDPWLLQQNRVNLSLCIFAKETEELKQRNEAIKAKTMGNRERDGEKESVLRHKRYKRARL